MEADEGSQSDAAAQAFPDHQRLADDRIVLTAQHGGLRQLEQLTRVSELGDARIE
jgi:hypothetical protein